MNDSNHAAAQPVAGVPVPPFWGHKHVRDMSFERVERFLNKDVLFRSRWEFKRGSRSAGEYAHQRAEIVEPLYARIKKLLLDSGAFTPMVAYGYFRCYSQGGRVVVLDDFLNQTAVFEFPRQRSGAGLCIADFFRPGLQAEKEGWDVLGVLVVTSGPIIVDKLKSMYSEDCYSDYFFLHGLAVEITDSLAGETHRVMRADLHCRGARYAPGYPACPNLADNKTLLGLVRADEIGVTLTESFEMVPEFSTSSLVAHHAQARHFAV